MNVIVFNLDEKPLPGIPSMAMFTFKLFADHAPRHYNQLYSQNHDHIPVKILKTVTLQVHIRLIAV
jgi:hypothetical protein